MRLIILFIMMVVMTFNVIAENYAFLFSFGNTTRDDDYLCSIYWYDLFLAYEDLILKEGYSHENIIVFYGNGFDWDSSKYSRYQKSQFGWDHIVDYDVRINTLNSVLNNYSDSLTDEDNLLIRCIYGHGRIEGVDFEDGYVLRIEIDYYPDLYELDLVNMLNQINHYKRRKILWTSCHSGALAVGDINLLNDKTTIITCANHDPLFGACPDSNFTNETWHSKFNYNVTSSLFGEDPLGLSYNADYNGDSVINFNEIINKLLNNPIDTTLPVIGDDCPMKDFLFVDEALYLDSAQLDTTIQYRVDSLTAQNGLELMSGSDITIACDKEIRFKPGFHARSGSKMHAYIGFINCQPAGISPPVLTVEEKANGSSIFNFFPNPTNSVIRLKYDNEIKQDVKISLTNCMGAVVREIILDSGKQQSEVELDVSDLPSGLYFVTVRSGGQVQTEKFVVIR